jgi:hypothetical protein
MVFGACFAVQCPRQTVSQGNFGGEPRIIAEQVEPRVSKIALLPSAKAR